MQRLREDLGPELFGRFLDVNAPDLQLYAEVTAEFDRRVAALPDFPERLADFRRRCERRREPDA